MIHIGLKQVAGVHNGTRGIASIHVGTRLAYSVGSGGDPVLFDGGYVDGIEWSGNLLTRPNYTAQGHADLSRVETYGDMRISIYQLNSTSYNAHVCTTDKVAIPSDATKMYVRARRGVYSAYMKIGLLSDAYVNACSGEGGVMSGAIAVSATDADYSIDLPAGFAGSSDFRAVINIQDTAASQRDIFITKVWFE